MPQMTQLDAFSGYGEVIEARIIMDRESGRSKGFGFVTYESTEAAAAAISAMDGKVILETPPICYCGYAMTFMPIVSFVSSAPLCKCSPKFQVACFCFMSNLSCCLLIVLVCCLFT